MRVHRRTTVLALSVALLAATGPLAAPASAAPAAPAASASAVRARTPAGPDGAALRAALAGLPDGDATAALVRVGGGDGRWRGSAGCTTSRAAGRRIGGPASGPARRPRW